MNIQPNAKIRQGEYEEQSKRCLTAVDLSQKRQLGFIRRKMPNNYRFAYMSGIRNPFIKFISILDCFQPFVLHSKKIKIDNFRNSV